MADQTCRAMLEYCVYLVRGNQIRFLDAQGLGALRRAGGSAVGTWPVVFVCTSLRTHGTQFRTL